ncbi:hypothetical protein AC249_AIPGENE28376, partial [Exaiptasia diaphana]
KNNDNLDDGDDEDPDDDNDEDDMQSKEFIVLFIHQIQDIPKNRFHRKVAEEY